jgi:hypothetical protein
MHSGTEPPAPAWRAVSISCSSVGKLVPTSLGCWAYSAAWNRLKASLFGVLSSSATQYAAAAAREE